MEKYQDLALEIKRILLSPTIITIIIVTVIIKMNIYLFYFIYSSNS